MPQKRWRRPWRMLRSGCRGKLMLLLKGPLRDLLGETLSPLERGEKIRRTHRLYGKLRKPWRHLNHLKGHRHNNRKFLLHQHSLQHNNKRMKRIFTAPLPPQLQSQAPSPKQKLISKNVPTHSSNWDTSPQNTEIS